VRIVRSFVLVGAVAAVALAPSAAQANTYSSTDQPNDVVVVTMPGGTTSPAPDRAEGDIVASKVRHMSRAVVMTMRYRELTAGQQAVHWYGIRTGHMKRVVLLVADAAHPAGRARLFKPSGKVVRCHVGRGIDYTANTATVRVPRSCLDGPRRVKVAMQYAAPISKTQAYVDDARSNGGFLPVFGPWVRR
jgi:hypothetical protein